jgi:hypothetical protein
MIPDIRCARGFAGVGWETRHEQIVRAPSSGAAGPLRHAQARRRHRAAQREERDFASAQGIHRKSRHVLARHRRSRGAADGFLQRRRPWLRARARSAHDRVSLLRRQRHVLFDGKPDGKRQGRNVVRQFRAAASAARTGTGERSRRRPAARRVLRGADDRQSLGHRDFQKLPPIRAPLRQGQNLGIRAGWKRVDGVQAELAAKDQGRAAREGGTCTREEYERYIEGVWRDDVS